MSEERHGDDVKQPLPLLDTPMLSPGQAETGNPVAAADGLQLTWVSQRADLAPLYAEWRDLAAATDADVYLWPDWFDTWWDHFGAERQLACLVARQQGHLVGVLPFAIERIRVGPISIRVARFAGTDPHCIVLRVPVDPLCVASMIGDSFSHLLGPERCDAISLTPVSARSDLASLTHAICASHSAMQLTDIPDGAHVVFDLPHDFETYLGQLSKNRRSQFRRDIQGLEAAYAMTTQVTLPTAQEFTDFVAFHTQQWQAVGMAGHFGDWPGSQGFYTDFATRVAAAARPGPVQLHTQTGRMGPLATQFVLVRGPAAQWRLPARTVEIAADRFSIGKVGLLLMIKQLITDGVTLIEAGRGEYDYKLAYGGQRIPVHRMVISPASSSGRRRLRVLLVWANLIHLFYYRLWFWKIAPRMRRMTGQQPRPLWRTWIRTRL